MVGIEQGREDRLLRFLRNDEPAWKTEDHPELDAGAEAWVQKLRKDSENNSGSLRKDPAPNKRRSTISTIVTRSAMPPA